VKKRVTESTRKAPVGEGKGKRGKRNNDTQRMLGRPKSLNEREGKRGSPTKKSDKLGEPVKGAKKGLEFLGGALSWYGQLEKKKPKKPRNK